MTDTKRSRRRQRVKQRKKELALRQAVLDHAETQIIKTEDESVKPEIEYVSENTDDTTDPELRHFADVFSKFSTAQQLTSDQPIEDLEPKNESQNEPKKTEPKVDDDNMEDDDDDDDEMGDSKSSISNKQRKLRDRLTIAQLKQVVDRPDIVELHDPNSADPTLLIHLKSYRNSVPVPAHWIQKRKYLQGKRGIEKPPFQLPSFIQDTGIGLLRDAQQTRDDSKSIKQIQRERMNPKMGKIDIDYGKLSDAFFKYQTRPPMTTHGDIYYAGKEFEVKFSRHRPGTLSKELREALGMMPTTAPAWLHNMQRFGPPPSYPDLKIPGLNAPLAQGCKYGFATGLWGKPPVDENGYPLYGDPFGLNTNAPDEDEEPVDTDVWGQLREEEESEEDDEEEESEEESDKDDDEADVSGLTSTVSIASLASGMETPPVLSIRKETGVETPDVDLRKPQLKQLYQVLEQKDSQITSTNTFGSSHTYNVVAEENRRKAAARPQAGRVQVALNLDELQSLDEMTIKRKYQEQIDAEKEQHEHLHDSVSGGGGGDRPKKRPRRKKKDEISGFKF
uniref:Splicing factor 3B subunit 2 n=2 Tax=Hirondellea gigas TaxID=1518452 RepID=A0A6A7G4N5_9CRUS